jgi:hypothetical protein
MTRTPKGQVINIHAHPAMARDRVCPRCHCLVTKWHEHLTKEDEHITATSPWIVPAHQAMAL